MTTAYPCTRHRCDFCRRSYASSTAARKHEAGCWRNPSSNACPTCVHFNPTPFVDCELGLGGYTIPTHPDCDGTFEWERNCPSWAARKEARRG